MALAAGVRLGPYEIHSAIGAGGMGEVWKARDTTLGRDVALKILPDHLALDPDRLARFKREAQILASLNHPNIATIHGFQESDGVQALVLELVDGPTLADRIAQGPIPVDEALPIAKQIAEALEAAHEQGIIHRDLKPANIKLRPDGTVKVLDFGLAKAVDPAVVSSSGLSMSPTITSPAATHVGVILGTAAYMSPEQARGRSADSKGDVWAFGAVMYEMLTGRRVFEGDDVSDVLAGVLKSEPDWAALPALPTPIASFLRQCLKKDPKRRLAHIQDMRLALEGAFETDREAEKSPTIARPSRRRMLTVAALAVSLAAIGTGLLAWRLWPPAGVGAVTRFNYVLPDDQTFRNTGRPVVAIAPDGRHFMYNTRGGLYLRSIDMFDARLIPGTEVSLTNPVFSPDGQWVAFFQGSELKKIPIAGGTPVVLCAAANPFDMSWESDNTILFGQPDGIMRVSADGGMPEQLVATGAGEQIHGPRMLPDGEHMLFTLARTLGGDRWDTAEIVVQSLETGERKVVWRGGTDARYVTTGHLLYVLNDTMFALRFDLDRLEVLGGPVPIVAGVSASTNRATGTAHLALSDQGTLVYADLTATGEQDRTLVWVDREGREEPIQSDPRPYIYPRISPDGLKVALDIRDEQSDIWTWDFEQKTLTRVTFAPTLEELPVWTSDGQRLVYRTGNGPSSLYSQSEDGTGTPERLTQGTTAQFPSAISRDGRWLVFGENSDLMLMALDDTRTVRPLFRTTFNDANGEISPDGRWIAYQSDESGQTEIYIRRFPNADSGRRQISTAGGTRPLWARNGQELFYVANNGSLMSVPIESGDTLRAGNPRVLFGQQYVVAGVGRNYDVSADGQRFLMIKPIGPQDQNFRPSSIKVVVNWFDELRRLVATTD